MTRLSEDLLKILACPKCKAPVVQAGETLRCTNPTCALIYPIRDGIPIMLVEEAARAAGPGQSTSR